MNGQQEVKAVLISGGAQGIGRAVARSFLQRGHKVYIFDINEEELNHTTQVHLKQHSDRLGSSICNLRDVSDIREKVKKAADFFGGKIDVLINNGGISSPYWPDGKQMDDPEIMQHWSAYIETNLTAPFAVSSCCIPYMKMATDSATEHIDSAGPCIIHVGSFRALQSDPNQEGYAASKSGQIGLMHSMAVTCQQWGIRVNLVAPGRIKVAHECKEGDEKGTTFEETVTEDDVEHHPTNRAGRPGDIWQAIEYFVNSGFVTGMDITVDGGVSRRKK